MTGMTQIQGVWEYIRAAYIAPWVVFIVYAIQLWIRNRHLQKLESENK